MGAVKPATAHRLLFPLRRLAIPAALALSCVLAPTAARALPGDAASDSVYLIGEFVDPVCIFQHGMQGTAQRECAMVRGRVEQGIYFLDIRRRELYSVIGQTHWEDPKQGFLEALGDTFAVRGRVWRFEGSKALAITGVYPYRSQPEPAYSFWPWHWEWTVLAGCGLLALLYGLARFRLAPRTPGLREPREGARAVAFLASLVVVVVSLNGPLHDLSDLYLFSTHMVQHLLLAQVFPLLFLLGLPLWLKRRLLAPRRVSAVWGWVAGVPVGFLLYTLVFSIWHVPVLYNLMMRDHDFHVIMHLMVMATAVMMWWPVLGGQAVAKPLGEGAQMLYLFLLGTPMMLVAALITFAEAPLYEWYALAPRFMGMSAVEDQRLGGLIMWVPGGLFFWVVMSVVFFRWSGRESRPGDIAIPARG
jgi:putative membrane protein